MIRKDSKSVKTAATVLVLLVWGILGYKIYQKMNASGTGAGSAEGFARKSAYLPDTFQLQTGSKDPFKGALITPVVQAGYGGGGVSRNTSVALNRWIPRERLSPQAPPPVQWPDLQWLGWIYVRPGHHIAIVKQGNTVMNWPMQESKFQCQIIHISADSLVLRHGNSRKLYVKGASQS